MTSNAPVALITGAGSGIGRAIAIELAKRHWRLALIGRTESKLDATSSAIADSIDAPIDFMSAPIDVTEEGIPAALIEGIEHHFGRLDALVNNAGYSERIALPQTEPALFDRIFKVNLFAPATLIARAWPLFERTVRGDADARPVVVNISSMAATDPFPGLAIYAAAKAGLESLVRSIRNERGELPLRAFAIAPGAVETDMLRSSFDESVIPRDRTLEPRDIALEVVRCIEGDNDDREGETILCPSP